MKTLEKEEQTEKDIKKICAECGGQCCKRLPGATIPSNFEEYGIYITKGNVLRLLKPIPICSEDGVATYTLKNIWAIDCWEGLENIYYLRPSTKTATKIVDYSWGGKCIFLREYGCSAYIKPQNCIDLIPKRKGICKTIEGRDKLYYANTWLPYQDMLIEIINELEKE